MSGGLRYESGRDLPLGMQELLARHYLGQKVTQTLIQENAALLAVVEELDVDCQFCANAWNESSPCVEMSVDDVLKMNGCGGCPHTECACHTCKNNSNYAWCGAEEALSRLAQRQTEEV